MARLRGGGAADGIDAELLAELAELLGIHCRPF
jgi:hypothetical protein